MNGGQERKASKQPFPRNPQKRFNALFEGEGRQAVQERYAQLSDDDKTLVDLTRAGTKQAKIARIIGYEDENMSVSRRLGNLYVRLHDPEAVSRLQLPANAHARPRGGRISAQEHFQAVFSGEREKGARKVYEALSDKDKKNSR